jgi:hypothetical protein
MRVFLTGATGFIGRALVPRLLRDGHHVVAWVRSDSSARSRLGAEVELVPMDGGDRRVIAALERCDAVVNLAGEPLIGARWTTARRAALRRSRIDLTERLVRAIAAAQTRPRVLVSGSAVGSYGDRGDEWLTEESPVGADFLAHLCSDWEVAARQAEAFGVRVVRLRTGIVLGRDGGALAPMLPLFRLGLGGPVGSGRQYLPWVHLHDLVEIIVRALTDDSLAGAVNGVAPEPATSRAFARALGRTLRRPAMLPAPAFALRAALGESASVLLTGQRVVPAVLQRRGFTFLFPSLTPALDDILHGTPVAIGSFTGVVAGDDAQGRGRAYLAAHRPIAELRMTTRVRADLHATFAFFSRAENLGLLTPATMRFAIDSAPPTPGEDVTIAYTMTVGRVPIRWRSRIVNWRPDTGFADLQEHGPYRCWWHEHGFRADGDATVMTDRVCYAPPLGALGRLANRFFVARTLRRIFQYRADVILLRFGAVDER